MRRVASTPLSRGMPIFNTAISGLSLVAFSNPSRPYRASARTSQPARDSSRVRSPARTTAWSSAIRMRSAGIASLPAYLLSHRNRSANGRSLRARIDFEAATKLRQALSHSRDAYTQPGLFRPRVPVRRDRHPTPGVFDFQYDRGGLL